ncbi:Zinc finger, C2H [Quillaja saponaria]|uniref:Zinc finger, C2H n=1 Tax=Quillaja saponaria TaxID=32244 RepID=A0AAD7QE45_QUISA|nr:Zinc finger, C2H [Quillaja saponaria]
MAAKNGWKSRKDHEDESMISYASRTTLPQKSTQLVACRLCDKIFLSNQELITHFDKEHMLQEENDSRRRQHYPLIQSNPISTKREHMFSNNNRPGFEAPYMARTREINGFPEAAQQGIVAPLLRMNNQQIQPPRVASTARNNVAAAPQRYKTLQPPIQQDRKRLTMEELPSDDGTRPFINQLDRPIKKPRMIDDFDSESDEHKLDLTLKLWNH